MSLQEKIVNNFIGKVVRKDLAFQVKGGLPVPTYVLEYLLGQYCATDDEEVINEGLKKVKRVIQQNYVHRAESETIKGRIREAGNYKVIDKLVATLDDKADAYKVTFANLGLSGIYVSPQAVTKNPKLLSGNGVWCIINLLYHTGDNVTQRWEIQSLKPIQISNIDLEDYISKRAAFTTDEWIDFLMQTVGLNPEKFNRREKFITLARLLPHVENNLNFVELGPKGTGKSHVYQELSPYGVLVSGGDVTSARLFVRMSGNNEELGLVGYWDVVAWDEFEQQKGRNIDAMLIDTMQNYLANKSFNRGRGTHEASASMSFVGNTKHSVPYMLRRTHLFESIPTSFIKGAFLDRIHLYNPGWEIKMLKKDSFTKSYGLITDYIAAVLHELRDKDLTGLLKEYAQFDNSLSERDHLAIRKTFSGMMKLLYPDGNVTDDEAYEIIDFATESRKRVKDQLYKIDETFKNEPATFQYIALRRPNSQDTPVTVETLEQLNFQIENSSNSEISDNLSETSDTAVSDKEPEVKPRKRITRLTEGSVGYRIGQTGVSYAKLFAPYLSDAKAITVEDPYIRTDWQIRNFVEFVSMLLETRPVEGLALTLYTSEEEEKAPDLIDKLSDLQEDLATYGITFEFHIKDFHDRSIKTDTGWLISLGRGLDIFDKYGRYSLAADKQERRKVKDFRVTYTKQRL